MKATCVSPPCPPPPSPPATQTTHPHSLVPNAPFPLSPTSTSTPSYLNAPLPSTITPLSLLPMQYRAYPINNIKNINDIDCTLAKYLQHFQCWYIFVEFSLYQISKSATQYSSKCTCVSWHLELCVQHFPLCRLWIRWKVLQRCLLLETQNKWGK